MEEPVGAQYALQIAMQTLKERCQKFQQRIALLEEENLSLRIQCSRNDNLKNSFSEVDSLKEKVMELSEQKDQLQYKIKLVTSENQDLWNKLSKLTRVNKNLGTQILKINESLTQHAKNNHSPLIRSKTFTQDEPQTKELQRNLEENGRISLELEDISLKLMNSIAKEKSELETLCIEISELQGNDNVITNSFGFNYDDEFDDVLVEDFKNAVEDLNNLKKVILQQKEQLKLGLIYINHLHEHNHKLKKEFEDKSTSTIDNQINEVQKTEDRQQTPPRDLLTNTSPTEVDKICPMCTKCFYPDVSFEDFQTHVESHFLEETYEIL